VERLREPFPPGNPAPPLIRDRNHDLWPALDRECRPLPSPHGRCECLGRPFQKRLIKV
jgi:hypothetical protein